MKDGHIIFEMSSHGISGMLEAINRFENKLGGTSVADKVAGKATALLCVCARVKEVYASTFSQKAEEVFDENALHVETDCLVQEVLDTNRADSCPLEKAVLRVSHPRRGYVKLKALQDSLRTCR